MKKRLSIASILIVFGMLGGEPAYAAVRADATTVPLSDGSFLSFGAGANGTDATAVWQLNVKGSEIERTRIGQLRHARKNHSATMLPDGRILVMGGVNARGMTQAAAEIFDPETRQSSLVDAALLPRSKHTATLLLDGRVLLVGGVDARGKAIAEAELWNSRTAQVESVVDRLDIARYLHETNWTAGDHILVSGGLDANRANVAQAERYTPSAQRFSLQSGPTPETLPAVPAIVESLPESDARSVGVAPWIAVRFDRPMNVITLTTRTVTLFGPDGVVKAKVTAAENGRLLFAKPLQELRPDASYTLFIHGLKDLKGAELPFTATGFRTQTFVAEETDNGPAVSSENEQGATDDKDAAVDRKKGATRAVDDDEIWRPGLQHRKGNWRIGRLHSSSRDAAEIARGQQELLERLPAKARGRLLARMKETGELVDADASPLKSLRQIGAKSMGPASLSGQALRLNAKPLANVTMTIGGRQIRTDANGEFILSDVPTGKQVLVIDGRTAGESADDYGRYEYQLDIRPGANDLPFTIWMAKLDKKNAVTLASPTQQERVITHPDIPGLELRIPAGAVIRDADGKIVTKVSITPVPVDRMPFPMPYAGVDVFYTIQPGGARIVSTAGKPVGATLKYPNYSTQPPGATVALFDYDPQGRGWYVYSSGKVSPDGRSIEAKTPFTIYQFSASSAASEGGTEGKPGKPTNCDEVADPVICSTGIFVERNVDLVVRDVQSLVLRREYQHDTNNQRSFGIGSNHQYDMYIYFKGLNWHSADAIQVVLESGTGIDFKPVGDNDFTFAKNYFESLEPGPFYKARLNIVRDSYGNEFVMTLKDGTRYFFSYFFSKLQRIEDRYGNRVSLMRDGDGKIARVVSPNGRWLEFTYGDITCTPCVTRVTDHTGRFVDYEYESPGRLTKITDPENKFVQYFWDTSNRISSVHDARGKRKVYNEYYSGTGDPLKDGRVRKQTYADNSVASFDYEIGTPGTFDSASITPAYPSMLAVEFTDERGSVSRFEYDSNLNIKKQIRAKGMPEQQVHAYERDPTSKFITQITEEPDSSAPRTTKLEYTDDGKGNIKTKTVMFGTSQAASWNFTYEPLYNQVASLEDPEGRKTHWDYDAQGRLVGIRNDLGDTTKVSLNTAGQVETITRVAEEGTSVTRFRYEAGDLMESDFAGRVVSYHPDALGRTVGRKDGNGQLELFYYDGRDLITKRCNSEGECAEFQYDGNGNLEQFGLGITQRKFTYDPINRLESEGTSSQVEVSYGYVPGGRVRTRTEASGRIQTTTYDKLSRPDYIEYRLGGSLTRSIDYEWDTRNRLTSITDHPTGETPKVLSYTYDDRFDKVKKETGPTGIMNYDYYANGLRKSATPSGGTKISYVYDLANQIFSITQKEGTGNTRPAVAQTILFDHDELGRRSKLTLANGITVDYDWNARYELEGITFMQGTNVLGDLRYRYDAIGQRIETSGSFARGARPAAKTMTMAAGRVETEDGVSVSWDENGRLKADATRTYHWDDLGRLKEIHDTSGLLASFEYDPLGRRLQKSVRSGSAFTTTRYLHDGENPIQLQGSAGAVQENLLAGDIDEWFARTRGGATVHFLTDALGSTLRLTNSTGAKLNDYTYDPYGGTSNDKPGEKNFFQYTGRENDGTGLYYYRARYYNPQWGGFISQDPIGLAGGDNLHAYVSGDPIHNTDPMGLQMRARDWRDLDKALRELPNPRTDYPTDSSPPGAYCGLIFCKVILPTIPKPHTPRCSVVCPNAGYMCRPPPVGGVPSIGNPGCFTVCDNGPWLEPVSKPRL